MVRLLATLVMLSGICSAQGMFVPVGESGPYVNGALGFDRDLGTRGISAGYCFGGVLDVGLGVMRSADRKPEIVSFGPALAVSGTGIAGPAERPDYHDLDEDLSAVTIEPSVVFHLLKDDRRVPFALAVSTSYRHHRYPDETNLTASAYVAGVSAYRPFDLLPGVTLTPEIGLIYTSFDMTERAVAVVRNRNGYVKERIPYAIHTSHWNLMPVAGLHWGFSSSSGAIVHFDAVGGYVRVTTRDEIGDDELVRRYSRRVFSFGVGLALPGLL